MESNLIYELIGYAASALVAVSLMMSAIVKLRIVNLIGALTFSVYGILIGSIPVAAMNGFIVFINIWYLVIIFRDTEYFKLLQVDKNSEYLKEFIRFYHDEIEHFQPDFSLQEPSNFSVFILRDMIPAGLILGKLDKSGSLSVHLDFVIPNYRDFKTGRFLFTKRQEFFREKGIQKVISPSGNHRHNEYLEKMGFRHSPEHNQYELIFSA